MNNNFEPVYPYEYDAENPYIPVVYPTDYAAGYYLLPGDVRLDKENAATTKEIVDYLQDNVPQKRYIHPLIVLALTLLCFPIGLLAMYYLTRWGAFPKLVITLFVLAAAVTVYEILVTKSIINAPSLIAAFTQAFSQFF